MPHSNKPDMSFFLRALDPEPEIPTSDLPQMPAAPDGLEREGLRVAFPPNIPVGAAALDRKSAVPLYYQIYLRFRDEILCGQRGYGSVMPTESEISELFDVSRITSRRVMSDLAEQGYIQRQRSKPARVIFQSPAKPITANLDNAVSSLLALNARTRIRVVSVETRPSTDIISQALQIAPGTDVVRVTRVRLLDDLPIGLIVSYVKAELASLMTVEKLEAAAMLSLLDSRGLRAHRAEQTIGAMLADPSLVEALGVEPQSAVLRVTRTVFDQEGAPFLRTYAHYRSDRFHVHLSFESAD